MEYVFGCKEQFHSGLPVCFLGSRRVSAETSFVLYHQWSLWLYFPRYLPRLEWRLWMIFDLFLCCRCTKYARISNAVNLLFVGVCVSPHRELLLDTCIFLVWSQVSFNFINAMRWWFYSRSWSLSDRRTSWTTLNAQTGFRHLLSTCKCIEL